LQLGKFVAAVDDEPAPLLLKPVEVEPDAPPVPGVPELPAEPSVEPPELAPFPAEPTVPGRLFDVDSVEPTLLRMLVVELEPEPFTALLSWMCPFASRQCVAGETLGVAVAAGEPLMMLESLELDCAEAERAPHTAKAETRSADFRTFIALSLHITSAQQRARQSVPGPGSQIFHAKPRRSARLSCVNLGRKSGDA